MVKLNLDYIAGFFDGEGNIYARVQTNDLRLTITNTRLDILEGIQEFFEGRGKINIKKRGAGTEHYKPCYSWVVWTRDVEFVLLQLEPHLHIKKLEAQLALEYSATFRRWGAAKGTWGNKKLPPEILARRAELAQAIKDAKRWSA